MSLKITTWNINGLRAVLNKKGLTPVFALAPDILMLQEIKARPDQIQPDQKQAWFGYREYWHSAERPGYSGVASFVLPETTNIQLGLGESRFDQEGRTIFFQRQ